MSEGNEAQNEASNGTNMIELGIQAVVKDAVDAKFNDWVQSGFDPSAINNKLSDEQIEQVKEAVFEDVMDNIDIDEIVSNITDGDTDWVWEVVRSKFGNGHIDLSDYIDSDDILYNMSSYDIWQKVEDHIDYDDIAYNLDVDDKVVSALQDYANGGGCEEVGRIAWRGLEHCANQSNNKFVLLSREGYDRIMEVVNMIKPLPPQPPTNRDVVDGLVANMDVAELQAMIAVSVADKAKREAEAQTTEGGSDGDSNNN